MLNAPITSSAMTPEGYPARGVLRAQVENAMNRHVTPVLGQAAGQAEAVLQEAREEIRLQTERLTLAVQGKPLTAIGLAALAGFVMARLMGR